MRITNIIFLALVSLALHSCGEKPTVEIQEPKWFTNFEYADRLDLEMDLEYAAITGIAAPTLAQNNTDYFHFEFEVVNKTDKPAIYYYKPFYQNSKYKEQEFLGGKNGKSYNPNAANNFYGSWQDIHVGFRKTSPIPNDGKAHIVKDSIRIVGNPRSEGVFFGPKKQNNNDFIPMTTAYAKTVDPSGEWAGIIKSKASFNGIPFEEQLIQDVHYAILADSSDKSFENQRWKRNPRVGTYEFMMVVASESEHRKIPNELKFINAKDAKEGHYVNPFYYFLHSKRNPVNNARIFHSEDLLSLKATFNAGTSVYTDQTKFDLRKYDESLHASVDYQFLRAHFTPYVFKTEEDKKTNNINLAFDVADSEYSFEDYDQNKSLSKPRVENAYSGQNDLKLNHQFEEDQKAIKLVSTGNEDKSSYVKQNSGISTRIGMTYGTYTAKIKFPKILSQEHVWNGITCFFGLINQEDANWNYRRECKKHPLDVSPSDSAQFSDISLQIVKASVNWPKTSYLDNVPTHDSPEKNNDVILVCSNRDMACPELPDFNIGVKEVETAGRIDNLHRWDNWNPVLSAKTKSTQEELLDKEYYFQVEWHPARIVWSIGASKDALVEICRMTSNSTQIPTNQMVIKAGQEFMPGNAWPTTPFHQDAIPFPLSDISTYIYDISIE